MKKLLIAIIFLFIILSVMVSWEALNSNGHFTYRDEWTILELDGFKEYFLHLHKQNGIDLDFQKRIVELWIHYFIDYESYDQIKFTILAFFTLISSFYVSDKILKNEKIEEKQRLILASAIAIIYLINPLNTQLFISYYPTITYALFPLFFYFLYDGFVNNKIKSVFLSSLIASFSFLMVVHSILYIIISFIVIFIVLLTKNLVFKRIVRNTALFLFVFISTSAYITLPYLAICLNSGPIEGISMLSEYMLSVFSEVSSLPKAMLMDYHIFWWPYVDYEYPFENSFFLISFLFSAILMVRAFFDKNDWALVALLALSILFFFTKGSNPPFSEIYKILNFDMPFVGWLIRVPMKFAHIIPFFFSLLFLRFCVFANDKNKQLFYAFIIAYLAFNIIFSWPFISGDMNGYLKKIDYGAEHIEINDVLSSEADQTIFIYNLNLKKEHQYYPMAEFEADIIPKGLFLSEEFSDYERMWNWSGIGLLSNIGVNYLGTSSSTGEGVKKYAEELLGTENYSVFRIQSGASQIWLPSSSHLCFGNFDTARSLIRKPPDGKIPEILLFPYSVQDYPAGPLNAANYLIFDSTPPALASLSSNQTLSFFEFTFKEDISKGWSRRWITPWNEWKREFDFGEGFAVTTAEPVISSIEIKEKILSLEDLNFEVKDSFTIANDSTFIINSSKKYSSIVTADLDLEGGSDYEMHLDVEGESLPTFIAELILWGYEGVRNIPVIESNGSFTENKSMVFSVPSDVSRVSLLFSSKTPQENQTYYTINDFGIRKVHTEKEGEKITSSFYAAEEGKYEIYLRVWKNRRGEQLRIYLDNESITTIRTAGPINHMYWEFAYNGSLTVGAHELTVEQLGGYNALNVAYFKRAGTEEFSVNNKTVIYRLTGKSDFFGYGSEKIEDGGASTFEYLKTKYPAESSVDIISDGFYELSYDILGTADIFIDGLAAGNGIFLEKGKHIVEVRPVNSTTVYIDHITLIRYAEMEKHEAELLNYTRIDPSTYSVLVNSSSPFFISFGKRYDASWIASVNGNEYKPVMSYGSINAYLINETGLNEIRIEFVPQKWFYAGIAIGIIGLLVSVIYVMRSKT